ncbi:sugar ABC transporter permease [Williamsia sp. CHRR-6]|nr:sugar ABC transporter permease [Williamsia sp. CHRR-6]
MQKTGRIPVVPAATAVVDRAGAEPDPPRRVVMSDDRKAQRRLAYWLIGPAALVMLAVTAYPIVYAAYLSFFDSKLSAPGDDTFIGFGNYRTVLKDHVWWSAVSTTALITVVSVIIEFVLGLALALVMHRTLIGRNLVRTTVLIPYGIVTVAAAISWKYAWTPGTGYLARLLPDSSAPLAEHWPAIGVIILAEVWKTTPFMALLLLAGLALVPDDILKAAQVDGAGAWTRLIKVTLPLMKSAILVALLFRTLDAFRIFDNILVLTNGQNGTASVSKYGYDITKNLDVGLGSAVSILIFGLVAVIVVVFVYGFGASAPGADSDERK